MPGIRHIASTLLLQGAYACGLLGSAAHAQQHAHPPATTARAPVAATVDVPLDAKSLAALPREQVSATAHGQVLRCEGVHLRDLLRAARAMPADPLRGADLARYVRVEARDGYRAVFSLPELDPTLGNRRVLLVDRCDGKPLDAKDGPLRLLVPEDSRPARWVRQVQAIRVLAAE